MWHTRTYFHSLINVCDRFLERTKLSRSGAWPGRELFIARIGWGAHGGANDLVPLLPVSLCEPDKAIRVALGERHVEKCAMRKTLSGGFWTVSQINQSEWRGGTFCAESLCTPCPDHSPLNAVHPYQIRPHCVLQTVECQHEPVRKVRVREEPVQE